MLSRAVADTHIVVAVKSERAVYVIHLVTRPYSHLLTCHLCKPAFDTAMSPKRIFFDKFQRLCHFHLLGLGQDIRCTFRAFHSKNIFQFF